MAMDPFCVLKAFGFCKEPPVESVQPKWWDSLAPPPVPTFPPPHSLPVDHPETIQHQRLPFFSSHGYRVMMPPQQHQFSGALRDTIVHNSQDPIVIDSPTELQCIPPDPGYYHSGTPHGHLSSYTPPSYCAINAGMDDNSHNGLTAGYDHRNFTGTSSSTAMAQPLQHCGSVTSNRVSLTNFRGTVPHASSVTLFNGSASTPGTTSSVKVRKVPDRFDKDSTVTSCGSNSESGSSTESRRISSNGHCNVSRNNAVNVEPTFIASMENCIVEASK
eukprot:GHVQ01004058.1.p1 GENE.GHVQ01004058.1~~GHVQ01004058.1.p1  ORF type:complete len:274 (+),score=27.21 GHVQ01004058.1:645-1466(+)